MLGKSSSRSSRRSRIEGVPTSVNSLCLSLQVGPDGLRLSQRTASITLEYLSKLMASVRLRIAVQNILSSPRSPGPGTPDARVNLTLIRGWGVMTLASVSREFSDLASVSRELSDLASVSREFSDFEPSGSLTSVASPDLFGFLFI